MKMALLATKWRFAWAFNTSSLSFSPECQASIKLVQPSGGLHCLSLNVQGPETDGASSLNETIRI